MNRAKADGFTLLELMLALSITAIIILLIFGIFRMGIRAWERGERHIEERQRVSVALNLMRQQLASLSTAIAFNGGDTVLAFEGDPQHLTFVSTLAFDPRSQGQTVLCTYFVEQNENGANLYFVERLSAELLSRTAGGTMPESRRHLLISGARRISFLYLARMETLQTAQWRNTWVSEAKAKSQIFMPLAVGVWIVPEDGQQEAAVILPIRSQESS